MFSFTSFLVQGLYHTLHRQHTPQAKIAQVHNWQTRRPQSLASAVTKNTP
jgi:hypothetical protein